jgi:hypothetical protein
MEFIQKQAATDATGLNIDNLPKKEGVNTKLDRLLDILTKEGMDKDSKTKKKFWKFPFKWKMTMNKSLKHTTIEKVLCFFINLKGELEAPVLLPIYNGNTLIYKYTVHEVDPRDIITLPYKKKVYKLLIYRIFDRKAVSIRDYGEVKERGDSTMDDEVFIKAMLTAKASQISTQQIGKGALIIGGLVIAALVIWFFIKK